MSSEQGPAADAATPPRARRRLPLIAVALGAAILAGGSLYWRMRLQPVPALAPPPEPVAAPAVAESLPPLAVPAEEDVAGAPPPSAPATEAAPPAVEPLPAPLDAPATPAGAVAQAPAVEALAARVAELELAVAALAERPAAEGATTLGLADVDGLLALAEQRLALARDVEGAAAALRVALTRLAGADTIALRDALADDLAALRAFRDVDVAALAAELAAYSRDALRYPLAGPPPIAVEAPAATVGGWRDLAGAVWRSLRELVEIRDAAEARDPLLNPAHAALARQQLAVDLAAARVALLARDAGGLRAALAPALEALAREFDGGDQAVGVALARLRAMAELDVSPPLPPLTRSTEALEALRRRGAAP